MAVSSLLSLLGLLTASCTAGLIATTQHTHLPHEEGCVHLPVFHSSNVHQFSRKRGVQLQLANRSDVAYYAQLSIGTPPQPVFVQLDTGSFELWVNPDCGTVSGADAVFCERVGRYESAQSSTVELLAKNKTLRYGIGSANISYVRDTITLAGSPTALRDVQFGVASATEDTFSGILGIGYGKDIGTRYPNFVDQLAAQNATMVKAYTLALGSKDEQEGVIVFGGVDTSRFAGPLARLPIIPAEQSPDKVPRFWINMSSVAMTPPNGVTRLYEGSQMPVFLDSGSTMTLLPPNLTAAIAADFGVASPDVNGFYRVDCMLTSINGTLDFGFGGGLTVKVPYKELIREVPHNPPACFLGISPSETFTLLGDTFLRSAYAVFDLETNAIWMTQAASCGSTPAAIRNVSDLGSVIGACGQTRSAVTGFSLPPAAATSTSGLSVLPTAGGVAPGVNGASDSAGVSLVRCRGVASITWAVVLSAGIAVAGYLI